MTSSSRRSGERAPLMMIEREYLQQLGLLVARQVAAGVDDHRRERRRSPRSTMRSQQLVALHVGQLQVDDHAVEDAARAQQRQRLRAGRHGGDLDVVVADQLHHAVALARVVLHQQHALDLLRELVFQLAEYFLQLRRAWPASAHSRSRPCAAPPRCGPRPRPRAPGCGGCAGFPSAAAARDRPEPSGRRMSSRIALGQELARPAAGLRRRRAPPGSGSPARAPGRTGCGRTAGSSSTTSTVRRSVAPGCRGRPANGAAACCAVARGRRGRCRRRPRDAGAAGATGSGCCRAGVGAGDAACAAGVAMRRGSVSVKVLPLPGALSTSMAPPSSARQVARDRQAQAGAAVAAAGGAVGLAEGLEDDVAAGRARCRCRSRAPRSAMRPSGSGRHGQRDAAAVGELDRVGQQVLQDLLERAGGRCTSVARRARRRPARSNARLLLRGQRLEGALAGSSTSAAQRRRLPAPVRACRPRPWRCPGCR